MPALAEQLRPEAPIFDSGQYASIMEGIKKLVSPEPPENYSAEARFEYSLRKDPQVALTLSQSLQTEHAPATISAFEAIQALEPGFSAEGRQRGAHGVTELHDTVKSFVHFSCADPLLEIARSNKDTDLAGCVTTLLFNSLYHCYNNIKIANFLLPELSKRIEQAAACPDGAEAELGRCQALLALLLHAGDDSEVQTALTHLLDLEHKYPDNITPLADEALASRSAAWLTIKHLGLRPQEILEAWRVGFGIESDPEPSVTARSYKIKSLRTMTALEKSHQGSPAELRRLFGIRNFGRYPEELLRQLYETRNKPAKNGLDIMVICSVNDHNGVEEAHMENYLAMQKKLAKEGFGFRMFEVASSRELLARASQARRNGWAPTPLCFFDAHGREHSLLFSNWRPVGPLVTENLMSGDFSQISGNLALQLFTADAVLPFLSCNAGTKVDGLAAAACAATGCESLGGVGTIGVSELGIIIQNKRIIPRVAFSIRGSDNVWRPAHSRHFHRVSHLRAA